MFHLSLPVYSRVLLSEQWLKSGYMARYMHHERLLVVIIRTLSLNYTLAYLERKVLITLFLNIWPNIWPLLSSFRLTLPTSHVTQTEVIRIPEYNTTLYF
jgi:hypothetical protein